MVGNPQLDTDLVGVALLCVAVVACHGTKLAGPSRPHERFVGCVEESALQTGFIVLPTKAGGPWLTFQLNQWMFLISQKGGKVHIDLWTPILLPPLGHSCEIVSPRLKCQGHTFCPAAVCWGKARDGGIGIINRPRCMWFFVWSVTSR